MTQVKIGLFKFGEEDFELRYVIRDKDVKFVAKDIATVLKYSNAKEAIKVHVDEKYKTTFIKEVENNSGVGDNTSNDEQTVFKNWDEETKGMQFTPHGLDNAPVVAKQGSPLYLHPHTILITKSGVIQLIMKSKLPYAVELQEWLLEEVIPQVLCTGKYQPAIENSGNGVDLYREFSKLVQKKDEQIQLITTQLQTMAVQKDQMISRVMNDMNRMYSGFQETMQKKDAMMQQKDAMMQKKDEQVSKLLDKMVDLSDRAVQYPQNANKVPVLCVARQGTTFEAITGQQPYVQRQKNKRSFAEANIVVESRRPNPIVDWNNAVYEADSAFGKNNVKRLKRSLYFDSSEDAALFEDRLKTMLQSRNLLNKKN
ncbi:bro [Peridroma alphabaculovirus]|uniref:Bro n=1 Tax=Peridroma alphabaculovirus TaxID=1346829 RepID=A0A068LKU6_9ABAC|nr:bro [Peridroma alphabaculovirus]AIE47808.1 bro [Peridroma alphabaculovirus]